MTKLLSNNKFIIIALILTGVSLFFTSFAQNFIGPTCAPAQCQGKIGVDSGGNISIGTSTPQSSVRTYIAGQTSDSSSYGLKIVSSNSSPVLWVRNDGRVSIATTTFNYTLTVGGDIYGSGNLTVAGNFSAPLSAGNVTPGVFNSLQGGGTGAYAFLGSLGVATTSQVGLPQTLSVYGGGYFSGNVGIGTTNPSVKLEVIGSVSSTLLYLPNTIDSATGVIYKGSNRFIHNYASSTSDGNNTFVGINAGNFTMGPGGGASYLGSYNTAVGVNTLTSNTTGYYNSAMGMNALRANTTGNSNSAVGVNALISNTTGSYNSAMGMNALRANDAGNSNSAMGYAALNSNTIGYDNSAMGRNALTSNTVGYYNSAMGSYALYSNNMGNNNSAMGVYALYSNTTGNYNLAVGVSALRSNTTGANNVALGYRAGYGDGSNPDNRSVIDNNMVFLGTYASRDASVPTSTALSNGIAIGYNAKVLASNQVVLGNDSITTTLLKGNVGIGTTTPAYKLDVQGGQINSSGGLCIAGDCKTSWSEVGGGGFWTAGTGGIYYTGNVSIGTSTISYPLFVSTSTDNLFAIRRTGATYPTIFKQGTDGALVINNNNSDIFTIKSGKVGIGATNPSYKLETVESGSSNYFLMSTFSSQANDANGWRTQRARGTSLSPANVSNGDAMLYLSSLGYYNGAYRLAAEVSMIVDGTPSGTVVPGLISFETFGSGGGGKMVLNSSGNVGIGTTTPAYKLDVWGGQINSSGGLCIAGDCKTSWSQVGGGGFWTAGTGGIYYTGNTSIGTSTISYPLFVSTSTDNLFAIRRTGATYPTIFKQGTDGALVINNNNSDIFTIKSGNVGIGTTTPAYKLDVWGGQINSSGGLCIAGDCKTSWSQTLVHYNIYPAANGQSGSLDMGDGWSAGTGITITGGGSSPAWLRFPSSTVETAYLNVVIPNFWNGGQVDFIMKGTRSTGVGTGVAVFEVSTKCYADGSDPNYVNFTNPTSTAVMNITVDGTQTIHTLNFSNINMTGCSPGDYFKIRLRRLATDPADTFNGYAGIYLGIIVWRENI